MEQLNSSQMINDSLIDNVYNFRRNSVYILYTDQIIHYRLK